VPFTDYEAAPATIAEWAQKRQDKEIALHGWKIFAAITADSGQTYAGGPVPKFATWYTEADLFNPALTPADVDSAHAGPRLPGHLLRQSGGESVISFNKYNRALRQYVLTNGYNKVETMMKLLAAKTAETADPPLDGVVLKPTYWGVKKGQATAVPYWKGPELTISGTVRPDKPTDHTWTQAVLVNDTGKPVTIQPVTMEVWPKAGPKKIQITPSKVVVPEDFYAVRLEAQDIQWLKEGKVFQFGGVPIGDLEPGDLALLVGMHVTTVEWVDWTWQTFWWTPAPEDPLGTGRPGVKPPFTNYNMASAYYQMNAGDQPHIAFNPHLEPPITGQIFHDQTQTGSHSNCMTCHRAAAFPTVNSDPNPGNALMGSYMATGTIEWNNPIFQGRVRTHNMWGLVLGTQFQPNFAALLNK
jgi:hypothetical protein